MPRDKRDVIITENLKILQSEEAGIAIIHIKSNEVGGIIHEI